MTTPGARSPTSARSRKATPAPAQRIGRPYDHSSDEQILASTLDLLAERDYERVTLDEVALRVGKAKTTLYRRWATKEELVVAAIRAAGRPSEADQLPNLGSLRSNLIAVLDSQWLGGTERRLSIFAGLASAMRSSEALAKVIRSEVTDPYIEIYRRLLDRAVGTGEIRAEFAARIPVLAQVIPAMSTQNLGTGREPAQRDFFVSVVDDVVLAALHLGTR